MKDEVPYNFYFADSDLSGTCKVELTSTLQEFCQSIPDTEHSVGDKWSNIYPQVSGHPRSCRWPFQSDISQGSVDFTVPFNNMQTQRHSQEFSKRGRHTLSKRGHSPGCHVIFATCCRLFAWKELTKAEVTPTLGPLWLHPKTQLNQLLCFELCCQPT